MFVTCPSAIVSYEYNLRDLNIIKIKIQQVFFTNIVLDKSAVSYKGIIILLLPPAFKSKKVDVFC